VCMCTSLSVEEIAANGWLPWKMLQNGIWEVVWKCFTVVLDAALLEAGREGECCHVLWRGEGRCVAGKRYLTLPWYVTGLPSLMEGSAALPWWEACCKYQQLYIMLASLTCQHHCCEGVAKVKNGCSFTCKEENWAACTWTELMLGARALSCIVEGRGNSRLVEDILSFPWYVTGPSAHCHGYLLLQWS